MNELTTFRSKFQVAGDGGLRWGFVPLSR